MGLIYKLIKSYIYNIYLNYLNIYIIKQIRITKDKHNKLIEDNDNIMWEYW